MKKSMVLFLSGIMFLSFATSAFAYSASSLRRDISNMNYEIKKNNSKISSIKSSSRISDYDKKRQIRKLEQENYKLKREVTKLKSEYRKAIS